MICHQLVFVFSGYGRDHVWVVVLTVGVGAGLMFKLLCHGRDVILQDILLTDCSTTSTWWTTTNSQFQGKICTLCYQNPCHFFLRFSGSCHGRDVVVKFMGQTGRSHLKLIASYLSFLP
jgi:hypothetical protein